MKKYTAVSVRQLDRKGKPWQARAKYKDVYGKWKELSLSLIHILPEIAAMGAFEGLDVMLNDALYGILFRDINMQRTLVDQNFSRAINAYAGVVINTGEDNYLTTADAVEEAHTVLA